MSGYIFVTPDSTEQAVHAGQSVIDNCYILSFDLDNTLITTKSGKTFAVDRDDWKWKYANIFGRISKSIKLISKQLRKCCNRITPYVVVCVITNQLGVKKNKVSASDVKIKLARIINELSNNIHEQSMSICAIASIEDDLCRKPRTQSLEIIKHSLSIQNILGGAYVGDASGYSGSWSDVDRKFAINADFDFYSDNEYFNNPAYVSISNRPVPALLLEYKAVRNDISYKNISESIISNDKCLIIMCGSPASGKTTFIQNVKKELENFQSVIVSQDELKTKTKCKKAVVNYIQDNTGYIFIDNCNASKEVRDDWINLADKYHYSHLIFYLKTSKELSLHLNTYRKLSGGKIVPAIAIHSFFKKLEEPHGQFVKTFLSKEIIESSAVSNSLLFQYL